MGGSSASRSRLHGGCAALWRFEAWTRESFDRLSVVVHRLRDKATRRGALRLLLGSSAAAALVALEGESEARRRRRRRGRCKGFGGRCGSSRDCCDGQCRSGFCFPGGGGGGGGNRCNGQRCPNGWDCCRVSGVDIERRNHPACFNNGFCPAGWENLWIQRPGPEVLRAERTVLQQRRLRQRLSQ